MASSNIEVFIGADGIAGLATDMFAACVNALPYAIFFGALFVIAAATAPASLKLDRPGRDYYASSVVSTIHSLIVVPMAWRAYFRAFSGTDDLTLSTEASRQTISVFCGYIMADTLPLLWNRNTWSGTTIYIWHHTAALACWGLLGERGHAQVVTLGLLICEATAPFVNGRYFLSMFKADKNGIVYLANGALMAFSFFALRICWMGWLIARYMVYLYAAVWALPTSTIAVMLVGTVIGYPMQILWFSKIASGLVKVLKGASKAGKKESKAGVTKGQGLESRTTRARARVDAFPVGESREQMIKRD